MPRPDHAHPTILLLGTGHWSNPGLDYIQKTFDEMRAPQRQREIAQCVRQLATFAPTHVALEIQRHDEARVNQHYRAFRDGDFTLTANERHQIGFRLAAELGHGRVHAIDWHHPTQPIGWGDAISHAREHGQEQLVSFFSDDSDAGTNAPDDLQQASVRDLLRIGNDEDRLAANHQVYMDMARIGSGDRYVGADVMLRWYERNMKIFVNISRLATSADDRIFVLIGAGHLPLLRHFIAGSGRYTLVSARDYLHG